jgi:hypothetical protein
MLAPIVELEKVLFYPEHLMKLSGKKDQVMNATCLESTMFSVTHTWKEKLHERSKSFPPSNGPDFFCTIKASFIVSCAPPSFINLGTRFLLREEGCNIPCYKIVNYFH